MYKCNFKQKNSYDYYHSRAENAGSQKNQIVTEKHCRIVDDGTMPSGWKNRFFDDELWNLRTPFLRVSTISWWFVYILHSKLFALLGSSTIIEAVVKPMRFHFLISFFFNNLNSFFTPLYLLIDLLILLLQYNTK